jgi:hypothetical protein
MSFGCFSCGERTQIALASSLWVLLARVQAVLAGFEFSNHGYSLGPLWLPSISINFHFDAAGLRKVGLAVYSKERLGLQGSYDSFFCSHSLV